MSHETLLFHYRDIRSRFLEADAHLDDVLSEAAADDSGSAMLLSRLERARTLALAAYDDYTLVRKRLLSSLLTQTPVVRS